MDNKDNALRLFFTKLGQFTSEQKQALSIITVSHDDVTVISVISKTQTSSTDKKFLNSQYYVFLELIIDSNTKELLNYETLSEARLCYFNEQSVKALLKKNLI